VDDENRLMIKEQQGRLHHAASVSLGSTGYEVSCFVEVMSSIVGGTHTKPGQQRRGTMKSGPL
jgi:hypothetical protein